MMNIGEFARHAGVSVRMLRHYDRLGLLVPQDVDEVTGYRRYTAWQLPRLNRLLALKDLGFSLEQAGPILDAAVSADELRGMLMLRRAQVTAQIDADRARLDALERRLRTIESEGHMSEYEFIEKSVSAAHVAQLTTQVADTTQISAWMTPAYERLAQTLVERGTHAMGPAISWYEGDGQRLTIAAAFPTVLTSIEDDAVEVADLAPEERVVTVIHRGAMDTIQDSWQALARYVEDCGMTTVGRCREVYLETPMGNQAAWVTELQQPVA